MNRRFDIDWLRVIAIGLLLIYHIAIVYQPWAMLIAFIRSEELLESVWIPMTLLNVWRIPILFYISGMGVFFAMRKRNSFQLVKERVLRILVPFLFGVVAITPIHIFIFQKYYNLNLEYYPHMGHLWFLGNIFVYLILCLPVFLLLKKTSNSIFQSFVSKLFSNPIGVLLINIPFIIEALIINPKPFALYAQTWHGFFLGWIAFLLGFLFMYAGDKFWNMISKWRWLYIGLASILFTVRYTLYATEGLPYLTAIESNMWILALFGFCFKYLNQPSKVLTYLSQAAYPVYIIHMMVLYFAASCVLPLHLNPFLSMLLVIIITFIICFLLYEFIIRRIAFLRPLFGLKIKPKETTAKRVEWATT